MSTPAARPAAASTTSNAVLSILATIIHDRTSDAERLAAIGGLRRKVKAAGGLDKFFATIQKSLKPGVKSLDRVDAMEDSLERFSRNIAEMKATNLKLSQRVNELVAEKATMLSIIDIRDADIAKLVAIVADRDAELVRIKSQPQATMRLDLLATEQRKAVADDFAHDTCDWLRQQLDGQTAPATTLALMLNHARRLTSRNNWWTKSGVERMIDRVAAYDLIGPGDGVFPTVQPVEADKDGNINTTLACVIVDERGKRIVVTQSHRWNRPTDVEYTFASQRLQTGGRYVDSSVGTRTSSREALVAYARRYQSWPVVAQALLNVWPDLVTLADLEPKIRKARGHQAEPIVEEQPVMEPIAPEPAAEPAAPKAKRAYRRKATSQVTATIPVAKPVKAKVRTKKPPETVMIDGVEYRVTTVRRACRTVRAGDDIKVANDRDERTRKAG